MSSNANSEPSTAIPKAIDYTKFIPFATAALIFFGISRLLFYYDFFGINILSFLEFSEIITSFLDSIVVLGLVAVGIFGQFVIMYKQPTTKETEEELPKSPSERKNKLTWSIVGMLSSAGIFIFSVYNFLRNFQGVYILLIFLGVTAFMSYVLYQIYRKHTVKYIRQISLIVLILFIAEMSIIVDSILEYRKVKYHKKYQGTRIVFNNETFLKDSSHILISDICNFYIGKTNNYIFIHHLKEGTTSVYPMSSVVQMDVKRNIETNWVRKLFE